MAIRRPALSNAMKRLAGVIQLDGIAALTRTFRHDNIQQHAIWVTQPKALLGQMTKI
jgi:hypothetical protein